MFRRAAALLAALSPAASWADLPRCGPHCPTPGRYVICNDAFDAGDMISGSIGFNSLEWACAAFTAPIAGAFQLRSAVGLFVPRSGASNPTIFELRVFPRGMGAPPTPPQFTPTQTGNVQIPTAGVPSFVDMALTPTYSITGDFRVCLQAGLDDSDMGLAYDADGIQPDRNFAVGIGVPWRDVSTSGATGDFVLRAVVDTGELGPWGPGGACERPDAGVSAPDAAPIADAAAPPADAAAPPADAAGAPDATDARDAAELADASVGADGGVGFDDAASPADASSAADAGPALGPPTISSISPSTGSSATETHVIVSGTGFVAGASLTIGTTAATEVSVPGSTTLRAVVPAGLAVGVHDVVVENADRQAAVLPGGFTVTAPVGGAPPADSCDCASSDGSSGALLLLSVLGVLRRRRSAGQTRPSSGPSQ